MPLKLLCIQFFSLIVSRVYYSANQNVHYQSQLLISESIYYYR
jgi:hypothetical protein